MVPRFGLVLLTAACFILEDYCDEVTSFAGKARVCDFDVLEQQFVGIPSAHSERCRKQGPMGWRDNCHYRSMLRDAFPRWSWVTRNRGGAAAVTFLLNRLCRLVC